MLTSYEESFKTWIFAKNAQSNGVPIARLLDFIINPETGIFEAIWVQSTHGMKLIFPQDIIEWNEDSIFINDETELLDIDQLPRIQKTIKKEIPILKADVFTHKTKLHLGSVTDFAFDTISPRLLSITVERGLWPFKQKSVIIKARIKKITAKGIFVEEPSIKTKITKPETESEKIKNKLLELD